MNQKALKIINPILLLIMLAQGISGVFMKFGWLYSPMYMIHNVTGFILLGLVFLHILFNWSWIRNNILKKKKKTE